MLIAPFIVLLAVSTASTHPLGETHRHEPDPDGHAWMYGAIVASDGDRLVVAVTGGTGGGPSRASLLVYEATTGNKLYEIGPAHPAVGELTVASLAISDGVIAVGDPGYEMSFDSPPGRVHLFRAGDGSHLRTLVSDAPSGESRFGSSVAADGGRLLVGAPGTDWITPYGAAYLYQITTGELIRTFTPPVTDKIKNFGQTVTMSGSRAAVAQRWGTSQLGFAGTVFLYDTSSGELVRVLTPTAADGDDIFGYSLGMDQGTLAVGSPYLPWAGGDDVGYGAVHLFDPHEGEALGVLPAPHGLAYSFGSSVAVGNGRVLVGANSDSGRGVRAGSAYLYESATLLPVTEIGPELPGHLDRFGSSVSITEGLGFVGAPFYGSGGAAYTFDLSLERCPGDFDGDRQATVHDLTVFIELFRLRHPATDLAAPFGVHNVFDVIAWIELYVAGCD